MHGTKKHVACMNNLVVVNFLDCIAGTIAYQQVCLLIGEISIIHPLNRVLPTLVGSGRPQPPLSVFYHHSGRIIVLKYDIQCNIMPFSLQLSHHSDHSGQNPA